MAAALFKKIFLMAVPAAFVAGLFNLGATFGRVEGLLSPVPQLCLFHRLTGFLCPGCGMTRGLISFFSYDLPMSFYFHPLAPVLGFGIVAVWFYLAVGVGSSHVFQKLLRIGQRRALSLLIVLVAWTFLRNVSF